MKKTRIPAFTLVELLIVIAIIGILVALLFPAVNGAIEGARRAQAQNDASHIAAAILAYDIDYGYFPPSLVKGSNEVDKTLVQTLTGPSGGSDANPKGISFLEVSAYRRGKSGTNKAGDFVDPWALTEGSEKKSVYMVAIDTGTDNITIGGTNNELVYKRVAVWNVPSLSTSNPAKQARRSVVSW